MATKAKKMPERKISLYNAFTASYRIRYIVHAMRKGANKTLCGREIFQASSILFDEHAKGACKKCLGGLEVERRYHPGWDSSKEVK